MGQDVIGQRIGNIRVVGLLGRGGMGEVYEGVDETLRRRVAVKAVRAEYRLHSRAKARFLAEARTLSRIEHPNICRVHEFIEGDDCDYLVLELVEGCSLREVIADGLTRERALGYARQLLDVLATVHGHGVVHRDLKPDNVMITPDHQVKVLDFGLARSAADGHAAVGFDPDEVGSDGGHATVVMTMGGMVVGTAGYMSPEQARGDPTTAATDIYSAGLLLHEMLTGRPAYPQGLSAPALVRMAALGESLRVTGLPEELELLVESMKSPVPEDRPTAAEAMAALDRVLRAPRRRRRRRIAAAVTALVIVASAVPGGMWLRERSRSATQASLMQRFAAEARDVEWLMRVEHMLPPHDIRPTRADVRDRIALLQREMEQLGPIAAGPGQYAVGRGLLALGQYREASDHLQQAWDVGYRSPEVASALGAALSGLYREELELANRIADQQQRLARKEEAARSVGHRSLGFQKLGRDARLLPPEYAAAMIAFDEERYDDAVAHAEAARAAVPWLYEASVVAARAEIEAGDLDYQHGEYDRALQTYRRALETLDEVASVAPSDAAVHALAAGAWNAIALARLYGGRGDVTDAAGRALAACDAAQAVDPDSLSAVTARSTAHLALAVARSRAGGDPSGELRLAEEAALRGVELGPDSVTAHFNLGFVRENSGDLEGAAEAYRSAIALDPTSARIHNNLGHVCHQLQQSDEAIAEFKAAIALDPHLMVAHTNLINELLFSTRRTEEGIAACRNQIAIEPGWPWGHVKLAQALMFLGEYEAARREAEQGLAGDPTNGEALWLLATVERLAGRDREALDVLERYRAAYPDDPWGLYMAGVLEARLGDDPSARRDFQAFRDVAREELDRRPDEYDARYRLALGLARLGATDEAAARARRLFETCDRGEAACRIDLAGIEATCGSSDRALAELERGLAAGYPNVVWIVGRLEFESLLDDPRFQELLRPYRSG